MLLRIIHLTAFKHRRPHGCVLNAVISQDCGSQIGSQIHVRKAGSVFLGDLVVAGPQLFLLCIGKALNPVPQNFRPLKEHRQPVPRKGVRINPHLLGGGNDDSHTVPNFDMLCWAMEYFHIFEKERGIFHMLLFLSCTHAAIYLLSNLSEFLTGSFLER